MASAVGSIIGGAVGSIIPGIGTSIGASLGGAAGGLIGGDKASNQAAEAQSASNNQALQYQMQRDAKNDANFQPYSDAGHQALARMQQGLRLNRPALETRDQIRARLASGGINQGATQMNNAMQTQGQQPNDVGGNLLRQLGILPQGQQQSQDNQSTQIRNALGLGSDFSPEANARVAAFMSLPNMMQGSAINTNQALTGSGLDAAVEAEYAKQLAAQQGYDSDPYTSEFEKRFTNADFVKDPGYDFRMQEGNRAVQQAAGAAGMGLGGGALKALQRYNQDYASNEFGKARDSFNTDQGTQWNRLLNLTNMGTGASNSQGNLGQQTANNMSSAAINQGNIQSNNAVQQQKATQPYINTLQQQIPNAWNSYTTNTNANNRQGQINSWLGNGTQSFGDM